MSKILIVDDEKHIRELYSEELKDEGYEISVKDSPKGLCDVIKEEKIDLLISDLKIQGWNTLEELQEVRNTFKNLPIVIHTAYDTFREDMLSLVVDDYIIKNITNSETLKNSVKKYLDLYKRCQ